MAEATIDELQIEISASSASAADNLEKLAQKLERLGNVIQPIAANNGLEKIAKQLNKLSAISQKISQLSGFEKIGQVVSELRKIEQLGNAQDISPFMRNLNKLPRIVAAISQMPSVDATKFRKLADALKPLQSVSSSGINSLMNALRKLPKVSQELSGVDFTRFSQQIEQISRAIEPLARQAERAGQGLTAIAQIMQSTSRQARQSASGFGLFNQAIGNIKVKTLAAVAALRRLFSVLKNGVTASAAYVENLNLFSVTMGESADEALRFAESVNSALGVDTSDWIRYQGVFQSIGKGFGIVSSQADLMSKNLTQMSYDISSFYNISVDTAAMKLQSALSGEIMPMRQLGFAIEETTLKQVALNHGIKMSVENMTQAQKAQLRYVAIMEQAGNIGVLGDMARTIDTASNSMRVFQARLQQFSRAIGNMFMPILSWALPYLTAFVQVLTEGAQAIANFFGFELPKIDFSDAQISSGFGDITGAIDEATEANEKFKGSLASIDQLNIIGSESESKNAANMGNQFDLGINLPEYDFLQGVESKTKQIAEDIKGWFKEALPWIEAVGTAIGTVFVATKIKDFVGFLGNVKDAMITIGGLVSGKFGKVAQIFSGIAGGMAAGATSGVLFYNGIKNLITGTGKLDKNIGMLAGGIAVAGGAIAAFIALGNPVGAVITGIVAVCGAFLGVLKGIDEKQREVNRQIADSIMYAENGGISIEGLANGFSGYFDTITSHYDDVLANTRAFEDNQSKISGAASEVYNLTEKYSALGGAMTESDAQTISDNIKKIGDSIRTNLNTATADLVQTLTKRFGEFTENADELAGSLYLLQSMGNTALADLQKHADELAIEISSSDNIDKAKLMELQETVQKMYGGTNSTTESIGFEQALKNMNIAEIDFNKPKAVEDAITEIDRKAAEATTGLENARNGQILELQDLKEKYTSWGLNEKWDNQFGKGSFETVFDEWEKALNIGYDTEIGKIRTGKNVFLAMVQQQFDKNIEDIASSTDIAFGDKLKGGWTSWWEDGGLLRTDEQLEAAWYKEHKNSIRDQFSPIQELIDQSAKGVDLTKYYDVSKNLLEAMASGAHENAGGFYSTLSEIDDKAIGVTEKGFEIQSPSKVFFGIGDYLMQGLANGIIGSQDLVFSALDYTAIQSIMRLSKLKEDMQRFNLGEIDTTKIITDFSFKAPIVSRAAFEQQTGTVREAYAQATRQGIPDFGSPDEMEATVTIHNYIELDGDVITEKVEERRVDMQRRMNGR